VTRLEVDAESRQVVVRVEVSLGKWRGSVSNDVYSQGVACTLWKRDGEGWSTMRVSGVVRFEGKPKYCDFDMFVTRSAALPTRRATSREV